MIRTHRRFGLPSILLTTALVLAPVAVAYAVESSDEPSGGGTGFAPEPGRSYGYQFQDRHGGDHIGFVRAEDYFAQELGTTDPSDTFPHIPIFDERGVVIATLTDEAGIVMVGEDLPANVPKPAPKSPATSDTAPR